MSILILAAVAGFTIFVLFDMRRGTLAIKDRRIFELERELDLLRTVMEREGRIVYHDYSPRTQQTQQQAEAADGGEAV